MANVTLYIDGNAPAPGDGSQSAPFQTLQDAVSSAPPFAVVHVAAALTPYDSPDDEPIRIVHPVRIECAPGVSISAELYVSSGARVDIYGAHFVNRSRPVVDANAAWAQRAQIMCAPGVLWLTDCSADGTQATKPFMMTEGSSTLVLRAKSKSCNYDYRGSGQMIIACYYGSHLWSGGFDGNILYMLSDTTGAIVSITSSSAYITDTDISGTSVNAGQGVVLQRGANAAFTSSGKNGTADRGRIRTIQTGIAASRKSYGHVESDFGFPSVTTQISNGTGASVVKI